MNHVSSRYAYVGKAEIGVINGGSLFGPLQAGPVNEAILLGIAPYNNKVPLLSLLSLRSLRFLLCFYPYYASMLLCFYPYYASMPTIPARHQTVPHHGAIQGTACYLCLCGREHLQHIWIRGGSWSDIILLPVCVQVFHTSSCMQVVGAGGR